MPTTEMGRMKAKGTKTSFTPLHALSHLLYSILLHPHHRPSPLLRGSRRTASALLGVGVCRIRTRFREWGPMANATPPDRLQLPTEEESVRAVIRRLNDVERPHSKLMAGGTGGTLEFFDDDWGSEQAAADSSTDQWTYAIYDETMPKRLQGAVP